MWLVWTCVVGMDNWTCVVGPSVTKAQDDKSFRQQKPQTTKAPGDKNHRRQKPRRRQKPQGVFPNMQTPLSFDPAFMDDAQCAETKEKSIFRFLFFKNNYISKNENRKNLKF